MIPSIRIVRRLLLPFLLAMPGAAAAIPGTWLPITSSTPVPPVRMGQGFTYDTQRGRAVTFSGTGVGSPLHDVWTLSLATPASWSPAPLPGTIPSYRFGSSLVYDPDQDRYVLFGGKNDNVWFDEAWVLEPHSSFMTWTPLFTNTPPTPRVSCGVYDPVRHRMLYFGGYGQTGQTNDLWLLTTAGATGTWITVATSANRPEPRLGHVLVYDPVGDRLVVMGGVTLNSGVLGDVWTLALGAQPPQWTRLALTGGPSPRYAHVGAYDPLRNAVVIFGGYEAHAGFMADAWVLWLGANPHWEAIVPGALAPTARDYAGAVWDPTNDRFVLYGGNASSGVLGDLWALRLGDAPAGVEPRVADRPSFAGAQPNPVRGALTVAFTLPREADVRVDVFDVAGRRMLSRTSRFDAGAGRLELASRGSLAPGMYLARWRALGQSRTARVVVIE